MITVPEAARIAGRDAETIRRWVRSGRLPASKVGMQHVIREQDLAALLRPPSVARPTWLKRTSTGEVMPDTLRFLRRHRASH
jgi:excisionase family DNA binding protein